MHAILDDLRRLTASAGNMRTETGIPRVAMVRGEIPEHRLAAVYEPMINLIVEGGKALTIGNRTVTIRAGGYFVVSTHLPATGTVFQGGPGRPYVGVSLAVEPKLVADILLNWAVEPSPLAAAPIEAVATADMEMLDAWRRLLRLVERPADIPVLAALYEREILYRVLQGPQGGLLREIAGPGSALSRINPVIAWIRENFREHLPVESLAARASMSPSKFHRSFKALTGLAPNQYQKRIRLFVARQMMLAQSLSASAACYEVGYESLSHFSRDYVRLFGSTPARDARALRETIGVAA